MKKPQTVAKLVELGRVQLSQGFLLRDFLYSEIAAMHGLSNVPDDPDLAIAAGTRLCTDLLEPLREAFGPLQIVSGLRTAEVNALGAAKAYGPASNERSLAGHIWDKRDAAGQMGATAGIIVPAFADRFTAPDDWKRLAWWIHDHLPYSSMEFFPQRWMLHLQWHEKPLRMIYSHIPEARGYLTRPGMPGHDGDHREYWSTLIG
ncbi:hypothetical protein [Sphingomonas aracearum]|uniref:Uncharacterized protein n=1 Tax=Sphingomonas aracearum TaxID=2283317 RepID=A0A369W4G6_9SPHN|nr:hypothetical protein [Sphingomonas aracearum]RDE06951.1 hypothetical protein DVW87_04585 [Sphingomonas aracearum]